jgi:hypothetical protein
MASRLNPQILDLLSQRTGKAKSTLRSYISRIRSENPTLTSNAAAHLLAKDSGSSLLQKLDQDDRDSLKGIQRENTTTSASKVSQPSRKRTSRRQATLIRFDSTDYFIREHISELNRAFAARCFTCVYVLYRKVIENLLIDILKARFPKERDLVFDKGRGRYHDFSVVLDNLFQRRSSFTADGKKAIERMRQLVTPLKADANDKAHSWFHIVKSESEIDAHRLQQILELVKVLEAEIGLR